MTERSNPPVRVEGLSKAYGDHQALADLSFEIEWGRVTGFLGPNGAGKTTTLRAILGLIEPTSGRALVVGKRYDELKQPLRIIGAVLDDAGANPRMTGRRYLELLADAAGIPRARVDEVLKNVDLVEAAKRRVGGYSLGMRRRLAIAAAILGAPRVLVLDEPANGLDPVGIRWLRAALTKYAESGNAVLVSSHVLAEIAEIADDVVVIDKGRLVTSGPLSAFVTSKKDLEDAFFELIDKEEQR
jgi:ABC-2 type transport system ATP-binding protein